MEILGLQWSDVDFKKKSISVRHSLVRVKGGYKLGEPKTKKSRRIIPMPEQVINELKKWKATQAKDKMKFNAVYKELVIEGFTDEAGNSLKPDYVTDCFKKELLKAELPEIRFHDLRHGHATMLLELGECITFISTRLSHST